jgi:cell volume regulation protein A
VLDRFFVDMPPPATPDPRLLGDFFVPADVTLGALAEIYGLSIDPAQAATSLADYFFAQLAHAAHVGDRLPLGPVALIAHAVADGKVTTVGLQLSEPETPAPRPRLLRRLRITLRRLKRLGR